jgi:hypothetical protein
MAMQPSRSDDLWLDAFLVANEAQPTEMDRRKPQRVVIVLDRTPDAEELQGFEDGGAMVAIGPLMTSVRRLKRALYGESGGSRD